MYVLPFFKIVGAHPASSGVIEAEVLWALERRVAALERQLREHQEALYASPSFALRELKRQVDSFKNKLEHNDQLSWLSKFSYSDQSRSRSLDISLDILDRRVVVRLLESLIYSSRDETRSELLRMSFFKFERACIHVPRAIYRVGIDFEKLLRIKERL